MLPLFSSKKNVDCSVGVEFCQDGIALAVKQQNRKTNGISVQSAFLYADEYEYEDALKTLVDKYSLQGMPAVVLMPAQSYSLLQMTSPPMSQAEMRAAIKWRIRELISYPAEEAVVDVFEFPESGQRGNEKKIYVVASHRAQIEHYVSLVRNSGLSLQVIDIAELALCNIVKNFPSNEFGTAILTLSERSGLLLLAKDSEMYLARRLEAGYADLEANASGVSEEILLEVQRSLDYFEGNFGQSLPSKLFVHPVNDVVTTLVNTLNDNLNVSVTSFNLSEMFEGTFDLGDEAESRGLLAIGASMRNDNGGDQ